MIRYSPDGNWLQIGRYWHRVSDGKILPVIQGGGKAVTVQNDKYAFGDDDGSESGHSLDTENTDRSAQVADVPFLIRIQLEETAGGVDNLTGALYADKNSSGTFSAVVFSATNDGIRLVDDTQSRTDDENTTERLSYGGAGTFTAGKYDDGTSAVGFSAVTLSNNYTDVEFCVLIDSANAAHLDSWEFRVEWTDGTDLDSYPGTYPTVTANIPATGQPTMKRTQGVPTGPGSKDRPGRWN